VSAGWIRYSAPTSSELSWPVADWNTGAFTVPGCWVNISGVRSTATSPFTAVRRRLTSASIVTSHSDAFGACLRRCWNSRSTVAGRSCSAAAATASSNAATAPVTVPAARIAAICLRTIRSGTDVPRPYFGRLAAREYAPGVCAFATQASLWALMWRAGRPGGRSGRIQCSLPRASYFHPTCSAKPFGARPNSPDGSIRSHGAYSWLCDLVGEPLLALRPTGRFSRSWAA